MKFVLLILVWMNLSGCLNIAADNIELSQSQGAIYEEETEGPTAKLVFSSPQLRDQPYGSIYLNLYVYRRNGNCDFTNLGRIPLSLEEREKSVVVPAGQRVYIRVAYWKYYMMDLHRKHRDISFVVDQNKEYTIEHIDNPGNLRVNFYQSGVTSSRQPLNVQDELCLPKKSSDSLFPLTRDSIPSFQLQATFPQTCISTNSA